MNKPLDNNSEMYHCLATHGLDVLLLLTKADMNLEQLQTQLKIKKGTLPATLRQLKKHILIAPVMSKITGQSLGYTLTDRSKKILKTLESGIAVNIIGEK